MMHNTMLNDCCLVVGSRGMWCYCFVVGMGVGHVGCGVIEDADDTAILGLISDK